MHSLTKTLVMLRIAVICLATLATVWGLRFTPCEFAVELSNPEYKMDFWQIPTWVYLDHHVSPINTSYSHRNIFSILRIPSQWCSRCGYNCSDLKDDEVSKEIHCAVNVICQEHGGSQDTGFYNGRGNWYKNHCGDPWNNLDEFQCNVDEDQSSFYPTELNPGVLKSNSSHFWYNFSFAALLCGVLISLLIFLVCFYRFNLYERLIPLDV